MPKSLQCESFRTMNQVLYLQVSEWIRKGNSIASGTKILSVADCDEKTAAMEISKPEARMPTMWCKVLEVVLHVLEANQGCAACAVGSVMRCRFGDTL